MHPTTPSFFDFLNGVPDEIIGFGGGAIILAMFLGLNWNYFPVGSKMIIVLIIYIASLFTGGAYSGKRDGALVAGVGAPIIYCTFATIWIRYNYRKSNKKNKTNYDHLIE